MLDWWVGESLTVCKILYTLNQTGAAVLLKVIIPMRRAHALLAKSKVRLFCTFSCVFLAPVVNLFCNTHPLLLPHYFHDSLFCDTVLQTELIEAQTSSEREPWNFFTEWVGPIPSKNLNHTPAQLFYFMGKVLHERATSCHEETWFYKRLLILALVASSNSFLTMQPNVENSLNKSTKKDIPDIPFLKKTTKIHLWN